MIPGNTMDRTPRWLIVGLGAVVGISVLSLLLRHAMTTGEATTLTTFVLVHFAGYLFFILSPVELLYLHMLGEPHSLSALFALALISALLAQSLDYVIGYACSHTVIHNVIGEKKYQRYQKRIERYGGWTILIFCLLPLSSPIIILVAGMIRYPALHVVVMSAAGLSVKYSLMIVFFL